MEVYNKINRFLKDKFGERVLKICINGGFTCPNRDGKCGYGGCIFCGEKGSGERTMSGDIQKQVLDHIASYRGKRAQKYIAYFQNFTNTYDTLENLKNKYDSAIVSDQIVALAVATRPDCIDEDVARLLATYKDRGLYVWVELGLQTVNEKVGKLINRGYTNDDFLKAVSILKKYDLDIVTHIMLGLPQEESGDTSKFIKFINTSGIKGLKIHSTYVIKNTILEKMYLSKDYNPMDLDDYIYRVIDILTHINKDIVIHRITGDAPKDLLIAPDWSSHKKLVLNRVENIMKSEGLYQGCKLGK